MFNVALIADIEKAFLNVEVDVGDRDCLRFLWPENPHDVNSEVVVYRFSRVVFGLNASPFLLNGTMRHHFNKYLSVDPQFVEKMISSFYVDDLVTGENSVENALELKSKARARLSEGGFTLRKWVTNSDELRQELEKNESSGQGSEDESYAKSSLGVVTTKGSHKVLGMSWDIEHDMFQFDFSQVVERAASLPITKRSVLSIVASLYDPLGILSPVVVAAKILFQEMCVSGLDWDQEVGEDESKRWMRWIEGLKRTGTIEICRNVNCNPSARYYLHGFADASKKAYCAVVYLVCETGGERSVRLLTSKTRVAPLKETTIPRLELMAARILAKLIDKVKEALSSVMKPTGVVLWSDSMTVLCWLSNNGNLKQFVSNRVEEILKLTSKSDWRHCPGVENPADVGSRGVSADALAESELWWKGPQWLTGNENEWPIKRVEMTVESSQEEKVTVSTAVSSEKPGTVSDVVDVNRFSSLNRLIKVTAWVKRFVSNLRKARQLRLSGALTRDELFDAETVWVKSVQLEMTRESRFEDVKKKLGVVEDQGVLRCKGRLCNAELDGEGRTPILLPRGHRFTELVVMDCHQSIHHSGTRATLVELRSRFWVPKGRQVVKGLVGKCVVCKKLEGLAYPSAPAADLPEFRVKQAEPFSRVGVDFAGPLYYKSVKGTMAKCYVALYTCCVTRAVHLDLVRDMETGTFRRSLRRFAARRGTPSLIVSDNAKTFKATAKALREMCEDPDNRAYLEGNRIEWRFNLAKSPWWGGFFERMVRCVKRCLKKTLGSAKLSFDELLTVLVEIEGTLNSRPLTYVYNEVGLEALTPTHLMHGRRLRTMPEQLSIPEDETNVTLRKRFRYIARKLQHFWNRWKNEYLAELREHHDCSKGASQNKIVEIGDVVVVMDEDKKRNQWKMGVIERVIQGRDGVARGASVRLSKKGKHVHLSRPIQKLFPVEIKEEPDVQEPCQENERTVVRPRRAAASEALSRMKICDMLLDSE